MSFRAWGAFAALGIIWGLPYFLVKISVQELSPVLVAFGRTALGAAVLLPIAWRRGALRFPRGLRPAILAFSLAEFVVPFCLISLGERWISSAAAGILIAMVPFWVALIQRFFGFHEPLGAMRSVGLGMGFVGVAALLGLGTISWPLGWLGVACILVAALGYAIGPLIIQRHMRSLDAVGPLATSLAVASAVLAIPALSSLPARLPSTAVLVSMVALGLVCTAVAMLLMFYLVSHAGASRAAVITYINPAVAMLLGVALLHERLGAGGVLAFVMILLGSWLATRGVPAHAAPAEAQHMAVAISTMPWWMDREVWRDGARSSAGGEGVARAELPAHVDVLVVGAGYTGLAAARETALAGRSTVVLDAGTLGAGCSSRNGGQVAYSIKPAFETLAAKFGADRAFGICREGLAAVEYLRSLARKEIDCGWRDEGCFFGAHTPRHFERMVKDAGSQPRGLEQRIELVPKARQHEEIASDFYHGGCVYPDDASVDPTRLLLGLLERARGAGASIVERCGVRAIRSAGERFEVRTDRGIVRARQVLLATNGYSGPLSPWHRRRVIPIGSYQIATAPLGRERVRALIPHGRNVVDSRRVVVYLRPSWDGERIIFGGRAALAEQDPRACVGRLRQMAERILPQLRDVEVTHAWVGWVAYTFDTLPHLGRHDGVWYCMGYCGQGVPVAPYLGMRVGQQMVGHPDGRTALDGLPFPSRPYYFGTPWFLAPSVFAYRVADALGW